jgi:hypothetical protein
MAVGIRRTATLFIAVHCSAGYPSTGRPSSTRGVLSAGSGKRFGLYISGFRTASPNTPDYPEFRLSTENGKYLNVGQANIFFQPLQENNLSKQMIYMGRSHGLLIPYGYKE